MTYEEAMEYLREVSNYGSALGLEAIKELLLRLDNPQDQLRFVHIGGTNGKGSTGAYITTILAQAGYKVGRYISPVVQEYRECIQCVQRDLSKEEQYISEEAVGRHLDRIKNACDQMREEGLPHPTIFEVETVMAFLEFIEKKCDLVVLEVGLGGRLDATNVIQTVEVSVLTSISMDHMQFLGDTLEAIATEKCGIIKSEVPVVSYPQENAVTKIIEQYSNNLKSECNLVEKQAVEVLQSSLEGSRFLYKEKEYHITLLGRHQVYNAAVAIETVEQLVKKGYRISESDIEQGLEKTVWFGRLSILQRDPLILLDGAHNPDAALQLRKALEEYLPNQKGIFLFGVFADKKYEEILQIMSPFAKELIAITPKSERALPSKKTAEVAGKYIMRVVDAKTVQEGIRLAKEEVGQEEYILAFGSLSFLGELDEELRK